MMKKFMKKLWDKKDSKKGFTLVELIVVLVILAILAAIMVPALLGWIDKAKEKQYVLEARNVYMATQAKASEYYAGGDNTKTLDSLKAEATANDDVKDIQTMADVSGLKITDISATDDTNVTTDHKPYTIGKLDITFTSSDGNVVEASMDGGNSWTIKSVTPPSKS